MESCSITIQHTAFIKHSENEELAFKFLIQGSTVPGNSCFSGIFVLVTLFILWRMRGQIFFFYCQQVLETYFDLWFPGTLKMINGRYSCCEYNPHLSSLQILHGGVPVTHSFFCHFTLRVWAHVYRVGKRFAVVLMWNRFIIVLFTCMVSTLVSVNLHIYVNCTPNTLYDEHRDRLFFSKLYTYYN